MKTFGPIAMAERLAALLVASKEIQEWLDTFGHADLVPYTARCRFAAAIATCDPVEKPE